MSTITMKDGAEIFYRDFGNGQPVLFSHGWPLTGDAWDVQMVFLGQHGFRVIAHDRRSHGRSTQTFYGNNMDQYADDLCELIEHLDLENVVLIGHSTGGGEVCHYIGRHGTRRVAKVVLVGAVPPLMIQTDANPGGLPLQVFDDIRKNTFANRSQFYMDLSEPFFGYNRVGAKISEGLRHSFWLQGMMGGLKGQLDCIREFSEVDYTEDLKQIDVPTLIIHGDDDQIVPIGASAMVSAKIVKNARLKVYPRGGHGLPLTQPEAFNSDLLEFLQA